MRSCARAWPLRASRTTGRVQGVELEHGERLEAHRVVVAAGPWSGLDLGLPPSARVPVRPVKGQTLRLRDPAGPGLLNRVVRFDGGYSSCAATALRARRDGRGSAASTPR